MTHSYDHGGNIFSVARTLGVPPEQIIDCSASINPLGISTDVRRALIAELDNLVHYPDTSHKELKLALANYHSIPCDNFALANGSTDLIYQLPYVLTGNKALIVSPSFSEYGRSLSQAGWGVEHFVLTPENNFAINLDRLARVLGSGVDVLFLCNPGNPSGILYPISVITELCDMCHDLGVFMVLDEAFMDFCEDASAKRIMVQSDGAVVLRSMTKFFGIPGLRLGYAICNSAFASKLDTIGGPWRVNSMALAAGVAALRDVNHNFESLKLVQQERCALFTGLLEFSQLKPFASCVNYLLVEIKESLTSSELKERLMLHHILIRDCSNFIGLSNRFFRVAVRNECENNQLLKCLATVFE